jgi:hypothetical protein
MSLGACSRWKRPWRSSADWASRHGCPDVARALPEASAGSAVSATANMHATLTISALVGASIAIAQL